MVAARSGAEMSNVAVAAPPNGVGSTLRPGGLTQMKKNTAVKTQIPSTPRMMPMIRALSKLVRSFLGADMSLFYSIIEKNYTRDLLYPPPRNKKIHPVFLAHYAQPHSACSASS
jgi:hypothetical protein